MAALTTSGTETYFSNCLDTYYAGLVAMTVKGDIIIMVAAEEKWIFKDCQ